MDRLPPRTTSTLSAGNPGFAGLPGRDIYLVWFNNWQETGPDWMPLVRNAVIKAGYTFGF